MKEDKKKIQSKTEEAKMKDPRKIPDIPCVCHGAAEWGVVDGEVVVVKGVKFEDDHNVLKGHEIIGSTVLADAHTEIHMRHPGDVKQCGMCPACVVYSRKSKRRARRALKKFDSTKAESQIDHLEGILDVMSARLTDDQIKDIKKQIRDLKKYIKDNKEVS